MLKTIPGFDVLTSIAFIAEVGDISRFRKANQVAAFLGLAPRVYSSGDTGATAYH
ncbi:MAG: IS110 family transposase [Candidatus Obscuribacter sp.]|nr:IS110 family transposase [Candidatus Obscuribacter sp.]